MNKESALASLGLSGSEDTATVARVYGERLSAVQDQLILDGGQTLTVHARDGRRVFVAR